MAQFITARMTADEYFALPESLNPTELLDGELIVSPAPVPKHQRSSRNIEMLIEELKPNGEVFHAPIDLYLDKANIPQPDIVWIAANSRCVVGEKYLQGPPELIVEIFSPSTETKDRKGKFNLYQHYAVPEYWMVDPELEFIEVYSYENGAYKRLGLFEPGETFVSPVLGGKTVDVSRAFGR
ncbi:MAG: Uma2 family endonuclease [Chloroflexi bacterium]|nr:Uma2 family endonuclease [Chloroflexota bacterium]MCC6895077.1 Uma2 family endonuclease [Anaerolineae bacterium]